jgi:hypothetical protein
LPRDAETLRKIVVDLAEQLDRSLAEQNKYQSLLRELLVNLQFHLLAPILTMQNVLVASRGRQSAPTARSRSCSGLR